MAKKEGKKKASTIRELAEQAAEQSSKTSTQPAKSQETTKKRRFLRLRRSSKPRRFHIVPKFFRESWAEIRGVTWPTRRNTLKLTLAVIMFSTVFALLVDGVDFGLVRIFKKVLLHG